MSVYTHGLTLTADDVAEIAGVPVLPNKREQEKSRLLAIIVDPLESTLCRQLAGEELFALGRLVELDYQLSQLRDVNGGDVRRQAG